MECQCFSAFRLKKIFLPSIKFLVFNIELSLTHKCLFCGAFSCLSQAEYNDDYVDGGIMVMLPVSRGSSTLLVIHVCLQEDTSL